MKWRRGLLLAGINVGTALPMICILAARDAQSLSDLKQRSSVKESLQIDSSGETSEASAREVPVQEEQTVDFSPCGLWEHMPSEISVVQLGNIPAAIVTQWQTACPPKWSLAAELGVSVAGRMSDQSFRAMRRVDVALCLLIAIQWFLIGGFPLIQSRRWWGEPGAFITACTAAGSCISLIPVVEGLARLPALGSLSGWLWWFGLLLWKPVRTAWSSTLHGLRRLSN